MSSLKATIFDIASGFEDFMKEFDLPSTTIPLNDLMSLFKRVKGGVWE